MAKTVVVAGVGPGLGEALVRRFGREGDRVGMFARSLDYLEELAGRLKGEGITALPAAVDITDQEQVREGFAKVREALGPVDVLINHAGHAVWRTFSELSPEDFEKSWRVCAYGAFLCSREAAKDMEASGGGTILFTGATSSIRGRGGAAAFSSAKFASRGLAWAMARELWPKGIHVAHVIIDGVIDTPQVRKRMEIAEDEPLLDPAEIADAYRDLAQQGRSAWSFEVDVRPHKEAFFE